MSQALYIVKRGRVRVVREGAVIGKLGEGELFGEMSIVDRRRRFRLETE